MRKIKYIVMHCTGTLMDVAVITIQKYWKENLKWKVPGYHYIIDKDGDITKLVDDSKIANGVKGYNALCIHVSYVGGINEAGEPYDSRTALQMETMEQILAILRIRYPIAHIKGHKDFPNVHKACPSFNVDKWVESISKKQA